MIGRRRLLLLCLAAAAMPWPLGAQPFDPGLFAEMRWRLVGPFRGGRALAAAGVHALPRTQPLVVRRWQEILGSDLVRANSALKAARLPPLEPQLSPPASRPR